MQKSMQQKILTIGMLLLFPGWLSSQIKWQALDSGVKAGFRGMSVVDENTVWLSGTDGTVMRTIDGGKTFNNVSIVQIDKYDFRDVHAFDRDTAVVLNAGSPGAIYRTENGGTTWTRVYNDTRAEIFFDAMDFWDDKHGIAFGDAIAGRLVIIRTTDGGKSWSEIPRSQQPQIQTGEGGFAASGTCLIATGTQTVWIATGSHRPNQSSDFSRLLVSRDRGKTWSSVKVPIPRNPSSGIFSVCFSDKKNGVAVGGDYRKPDNVQNNIAITSDGGKTWSVPKFKNERQRPSGFRSVVVATMQNGKSIFVAAGTNGIDVSSDNGQTWQRQADLATNVLFASPRKKTLFGAGPNGVVFKGTQTDSGENK